MAKILTIADATVVEAVQELLSQEGHQVQVAFDAKEGLDLARTFSPDLIFCDGDAPEIEWLEVCRLMKADRALAEVYFIILSTPDQFDGGVELDELVDDLVFKPIVKQELLARMRAGLRSQKLKLELERSQQELKLSRERILESAKMSKLGDLASGIAHEINNPITFIYSNLTHVQSYASDLIELLQLYQKQSLNPSPEILKKQQEMDVDFVLDDLLKIVSSMRTGSDRIRQIILSVQDYSRSDRSGWQLFDVSDGLENTLLLLQHRLPAREGRRDIKVIKEYGNLPQIECYAGQLNQAFLNIIDYAIDALEMSCEQLNQSEYISFRPVIWVRTQVVNSHKIAIEIADNGIVMSEDLKAHIFEPFFMAKPVDEFNWLGLAVSYLIVVEQHKGELKYFSEPGKGNKFRIEIPLRHS
jgi:two-component system, NtrC family, sensor kinase